MNLFTHVRPEGFNRDDVVVRHELGHTVTWYSFGRDVCHIRFKRSPIDARLQGGAANVNPPSFAHLKDAKEFVERMLAGESAARRSLGESRDQISTMPVEVKPETNIPALVRVVDSKNRVVQKMYYEYLRQNPDWFATVRCTCNGMIPLIDLEVTAKVDVPALLQVGRQEDDAMWVIRAAYEAVVPNGFERMLVRLGASPPWYKWLRVRLERAAAVVDANWNAIENIAEELIPRLPAPGGEFILPEAELVELLDREGVQRCNAVVNTSVTR